MKKSISRDHANELTRFYMHVGLDKELIRGVQNCRARAYDVLAHIHSQIHMSPLQEENEASSKPLKGIPS